jgi:hypothetical protein
VAQHKTAKQIGLELGISYHAVESHLKAARRKLCVSSTAEALQRLHHGMGQYYGHLQPPLVCTSSEQYHCPPGLAGSAPMSHLDYAGRLDEAVFAGFSERPKRIWEIDYELTPQRTLMLIGVATAVFVAVLAMLIAIGIGVNSLVAAQS